MDSTRYDRHGMVHPVVSLMGEARSSSLKSGRKTRAMMRRETMEMGTQAGLMMRLREELKEVGSVIGMRVLLHFMRA